MSAPYLEDDESVVLAAEHIRVGSVTYPALILTNRRILLVRTEGDTVSAEEYFVSRLRSALVSHAARDDPALIITYVTAKRESRRETFTFIGTPEKRRTDEVKAWAKKLSANLKPLPDDEVIVSESTTPAKHGESLTKSSHEILEKHGRVSGMAFPDMPDFSEPEERPAYSGTRIIVAAIVIVIIAALVWTFLIPPPSPQDGAGPTPTAIITQVPPVTTVTHSVTLATTPAMEQFKVPATGVWVRVQYSGNYTGNIAGGTTRQEIADSGETWYQLSMKTGTVVAVVEKMDSSTDKLSVDIFRDGKVIPNGHGETTRPYAEVNIQVDLSGQNPAPAL